MIPTRTAVDVCILVSQGAGRGDAGWKQMWTSYEWGDHERWRGRRDPYIGSADAVHFAGCEP